MRLPPVLADLLEPNMFFHKQIQRIIISFGCLDLLIAAFYLQLMVILS